MTEIDNTIKYRAVGRNDETDILAVLEEVAPEIPMPLENQDAIKTIIIQCRESGKSWVAVEAKGRLVGFALAKPDLHQHGAISLRYIGVSKESRGFGLSTVLIEKLKTEGVPLTASVSHTNQSNMANRLVKDGFTKTGANSTETQFRWDP